MASPSEAMLVQDELGPLYDFGTLYEEGIREKVTCRYVYGDGVDVQLTYTQEHESEVQSARFVSSAAQALCEYLEKNREEIPSGAIVELGAGCGLAGLAIAQLRPEATVVLTDHDPGVLKTVEFNCTQQHRKQAVCVTKPVRWGPDGADEIAALERDLHLAKSSVDLVVGSDIIYATEVVAKLFWTVDRLLKRDIGYAFLMCSSHEYDDKTKNEIIAQCERFGFAQETVSRDAFGPRIQRYKRVGL